MNAPRGIVGVVAHANQRVFETVLSLWRQGQCVAMLSPDRAAPSAERVEHCARLEHRLSTVEPSSSISEVDLDALPQGASCLFATSGTAGTEPRLARLSARALLANARNANARTPFASTDTWLVPLSLHHVGGFGAFLRAHVVGGRAVGVDRGANEVIDALHRDAMITHCSLVPTQLYRLLAHAERTQEVKTVRRLASLRALLIGGGPSAASLRARALEHGISLVVSYGMTECGSQAATARAQPHRESTDAGEPLAGMQISIAASGEIHLRGECMFDGYLSDGVVSVERSAEGFATGDRGRMDADGRLHVEGRIGLSFKSGGEFVQPERVERALLELPGVANAMVVDVFDQEWGSVGIAFVDASREIARDELREALAAHELPRIILPWPASLRDSLKPSRAAMRTLAESHRAR